ncbi:EamA family transporter [Asaia siamensis]
MIHQFTASWLFWAVLSAGFAALTAILAKLGVSHIDSDVATFIRTLVIVVILAAYLVISGKFRAVGPVGFRTALFLCLSGLATGASWLCYFRALKLGDAARVAPVDKLSVVIVAIFGVLMLGEYLSVKGWLGVVCITIGALLVATA